MKKLITLILVLSTWNSFAQLTLVKETNNDLLSNKQFFTLSNGEKMLYSYSGEGLLTLFKRDLSIYKVIKLPELFPEVKTDSMTYKFYGNIDYVQDRNSIQSIVFSDNFFNNDSKIEFIVRSTNFNGKNKKVLMNEDGIEIHRFESDYILELYYWDNLYCVERINNVYPYNYTTKVYSIPGNLPCPTSCSQKAASITPITQPNEFKGIQVTGFPNPSTDKVTLEYALPEGVAFGTLRLYTQTGELVKEFKVSNQVDHLELPVSEYTSGTYYYELQAGGNTSGGKKMVVIH
jgi:hypothetical protein